MLHLADAAHAVDGVLDLCERHEQQHDCSKGARSRNEKVVGAVGHIAQRTCYGAAVANKGQALAFGNRIPVGLQLASGLPRVSLAVHDAPSAVHMPSVIS